MIFSMLLRPARATCFIVLVMVASALPAIVHTPRASALSDFDAELLTLINDHRVSIGRNALVEWQPMSAAAQRWSTNMRGNAQPCSAGNFRHDAYGNFSRDGVPPGTAPWSAAENIAFGCGPPGYRTNPGWTYSQMPSKCRVNLDLTTPLSVFCQWVNSSGHRAALENPASTHIGVGTASSSVNGVVARWSTSRFVTAPVFATCRGLVATVDLNAGTGSPTNGDDVIVGTPNADTIDGLGGNDTICAGRGNDIVRGGGGNDMIFGEAGDDVMFGGEGRDTIHGGSGNDRVRGQNGDDTLYGGDGNDNLNGNNGDDHVRGEGGHDYVSGRDGFDIVDGGAGSDTINGGGKTDTLIGGSGNDTMNGNAYMDYMYGGDGNDVMSGGDGNDHIEGQQGNDDLKGNRNNDELWGGSGTDRCDGVTGVDSQINCETVLNIP